MIDTAQSETGTLARLVLKHPDRAFVDQRQLDEQWQTHSYLGCPDFAAARAEYDDLVLALRETDTEILWLPEHSNTTIDSIYVRDASIVCDRGVVLCSMGKTARVNEPQAQAEFFAQNDVSVIGEIGGDGLLEGGDFFWLDQGTAVVGQGYRSNAEGIAQLESLLRGCCDELLIVPLPHFRGPGDVFHLMSMISPVDKDLAVVYSPLMPVPFRDQLLRRGFELIEVPDEEFSSQGCNVLAIGPRRCMMLDGNPRTMQRLQDAGVDVSIYRGRQISELGQGGPTCLTRPLLRQVE